MRKTWSICESFRGHQIDSSTCTIKLRIPSNIKITPIKISRSTRLYQSILWIFSILMLLFCSARGTGTIRGMDDLIGQCYLKSRSHLTKCLIWCYANAGRHVKNCICCRNAIATKFPLLHCSRSSREYLFISSCMPCKSNEDFPSVASILNYFEGMKFHFKEVSLVIRLSEN